MSKLSFKSIHLEIKSRSYNVEKTLYRNLDARLGTRDYKHYCCPSRDMLDRSIFCEYFSREVTLLTD